ncbi:uncharacterized protein LOC6560249 [Drosophila grimshawi]|uniref:GH21657 n=1 Tax=Drosophila grimshawi TaxID=7222 RepID=B4J5R7_DROGR|nr:uncharacterized protein LOC6560249 [Drosophila grimshawi]EDW01843.1 GH21657 [Drosophila grimshawi]
MFSRLLLSSITLLLFNGCSGARNWDYEPLSIETYSSDDSKAKFEAWVERDGRNHVFSAELTISYEMDERTMIQGTLYSSYSGYEDDYKPLPWSIENQTFQQFVIDFYTNVSYANLKPCSNLPEPANAYPFPMGTYTFTKCEVSGEGLPEIMAEGYYKIVLSSTGQVDVGFTGIARVTTKSDWRYY